MELIAETTFKKMAPKSGFLAPYVQLPWGHDRTLIGKPVSIYKVDGGFFLALENKQFTPSDSEQPISNQNLTSVEEFKLIESTNKLKIKAETQNKECPSPDLNRGQPDLQSGALPV
jgi:hypothetical protein